jgi:hypothetical protein
MHSRHMTSLIQNMLIAAHVGTGRWDRFRGSGSTPRGGAVVLWHYCNTQSISHPAFQSDI